MSAPSPDLEAIVRPLLPHLGARLRAQPQGEEYGLVLVLAGRDATLAREHLGESVTFREARGHLVAAAPLARVRALAEAQTFDLAAEFDAPITPGQTWCLVLDTFGRDSVLVLTWPTRSATSRRTRAAN